LDGPPARIGLARCRRPRNGTQGSGVSRPASAAVPVSAPAREGAAADVRIIRSGTAHAVSREAVANYIAKYVTKAVGIPGLPSSPVRDASEVAALRWPAHHKRLIEAALRLGFAR
jgi:hypothetical protein